MHHEWQFGSFFNLVLVCLLAFVLDGSFAFVSAHQWHDFIDSLFVNCLCAGHCVKRYSKEPIRILSHIVKLKKMYT